MRVSEKFNLGLTQAYLDFVDIDVSTDLKVFVDPTALHDLRSQWGNACDSLVQTFFKTVLDSIKNGDHDFAKKLLSNLNERNEFHLGYSKGKSRGKGFGKDSAELVWNALCGSKAAKSGLLRDLEDTTLLIDGIGPDMISDAVCNIIRPQLIKYTQDMCNFYGIQLVDNTDSGPIWDYENKKWTRKLVSLPQINKEPFILVPKNIVRRKISYDYDEYYRHYILVDMQIEHINAGSSLVQYLKKTGAPRVYKTDLIEKYGFNKTVAIEQTFQREHVWEKYKEDKENNISNPISNEIFSEIQKETPVDWDQLLTELSNIPTGKKAADAYEKVIEKILSALFSPNLVYPKMQARINDGRKRLDIQYNNEAKHGFFAWVASHQPAMFIQVECKNYKDDVENPEVDQLAGRFSPNRGKIGLLICRSVDNISLLEKRCKDTAQEKRGFILFLTDEDLKNMIEDYKKASPTNYGVAKYEYPLLRNKFNKLIN